MSALPEVNPAITEPSGKVTGHGNASSESWQRQLADAVRDPCRLLDVLGLPPDPKGREALTNFPLLVPQSFIRRMQRENRSDPLLLQVLPRPEETLSAAGFLADPVGDTAAAKVPGLLQKYEGRALLIAAGACAVHCRYCFRREFPYHTTPRRLQDWLPAIDTIAADASIHEVILSGGDPLMLNDDRLSELFALLGDISHVERVRLHTRLPIVLPARVTKELTALLLNQPWQPIVVVHANHAHEIADDCAGALQNLVRSGIPTLNQAVLLKEINDSADAQEQLCRRLTGLGVMPYYLHQLDRVNGAAHFECTEELGRAIIRELRKRLPGYAVPRFVREVPGAPSKTPLESDSVR